MCDSPFLVEQVASHSLLRGHLKTAFRGHYTTAATEIPKLQSEIDFLKIENHSSEQMLEETRDLYSRWNSRDGMSVRAATAPREHGHRPEARDKTGHSRIGARGYYGDSIRIAICEIRILSPRLAEQPLHDAFLLCQRPSVNAGKSTTKSVIFCTLLFQKL